MPLRKISFTKMHGIGNDYIYIDCFKQKLEKPEELARIMSPRRFSVGADGVILICPSDVADAKMRMFNLDGSEGKMCGNGIRCVGKYIYDNNIARKQTVTVETLSGIKTLRISEKNGFAQTLTVDMGAAEFSCSRVPVLFGGSEMINEPVSVNGSIYNITAVSMGNPHAVIFCDDIENLKLEKTGPLFEELSIFPEKVNTEFVKVVSRRELCMRVWERGSGETLACGTGACASVAAAVKNGLADEEEEITVHLRGGELYITYFNDRVLMRGPAEKVYEGVYEYES